MFLQSSVLSLVSFFRGQVVGSRSHDSKISGYQQTVVLQMSEKTKKKKKKRNDVNYFPMHDCT